MRSNTYPRSTTPKRQTKEPSKLSLAMQAISEVADVKNTVTTAAKHIKPANRNIIGGLGVAALLYWAFTAKSK